ncbi:MAG: hypothetical protein DWQ44_02500 [Bacteroidetes bacterium]|nr:MAG: hypothetical protein DWQ33_06230 [Bacteroidota bacterium]REK04841.1 MAG: hypothetical protein DWQ39_06395 [Bacteroidota bacterium]REK36313.1 MAG: hypothetical protein DWQ44_02500 [Bacteroidota bacterium]REK51021.1 MAG: hypothetical protein DWQ48_02720 [Bacteroidota bacterium]
MNKNTVELLTGDEIIPALERMIRNAREEVYIQSYILEPDDTGNRIMDAMIEASRRNIKINVLIDAYGSQNFKTHHKFRLRAAGIKIRRFGKLFSRGRLHIGRRLHRKVFVADGEVAIVGGVNISNNYMTQPGSPAWLDFALKVRGPVAHSLMAICKRRTKLPRLKKLIKEAINQEETASAREISSISIRENDYLRGKNEIALSYKNAIKNSRESVLIVGGYFLPGGVMRRVIKNAVERGVRISVIVSENSDVRLLIHARRYLYKWMLKNNIRIFEYIPSNVHGKVLVVDNNFVTLGSYDLNNLSTFSNIELNLEVNDEAFARIMTDKLNEIIRKNCREVTLEEMKLRNTLWSRFRNWAAYQFIKTLFALSLWLANRDEKDF